MKKTTVLGIGNILLQDEGLGVRVVEELQRRYQFGPAVELLDGGTLGMGLLRYIGGTDRLLIVDAVAGGGQPGTLYRFAGQEVEQYFQEKVSLHELGIKEVLAMLEVTGQPVGEVVIVGAEPASLDMGLELTPIIADALENVTGAVLEQLFAWGVEVKPL